MTKWLGLLFMILDHLGYVLEDSLSSFTYLILRGLGRLSFPLFVYFVVLGVNRTSSVKAYLKRLVIFALITEVIQNLFTSMDIGSVNVLFSLSIYVMFYIMFLKKNFQPKFKSWFKFLSIIIMLLILPFVEYGYPGFLVFINIYMINKLNFKNKHLISTITISFVFLVSILLGRWSWIQMIAGLSGLLMFNPQLEKRVFSPEVEKWLFYIIYPLQWVFLSLLM